MTAVTTEPLPIELATQSDQSRIAVLTLEQPGRPVVVINRELLERLDAALDAVPADATGLVLRSASDRAFVAGADLKAINDLDDSGLDEYLSFAAAVFLKLSQLPMPTAAAINGAALGGGLELAMHCDGLIGAPRADGRDYMVGLPEAGLGLCPGWGGTNLLPARIDPGFAINATATGKPMSFSEARQVGLFDAVSAESADLLITATEWVGHRSSMVDRDGSPLRWIGQRADSVRTGLDQVRGDLPDTPASRAVAECVEVGLNDGWKAACEMERQRLIGLRHTPEAKAAIAAFFDRSKK